LTLNKANISLKKLLLIVQSYPFRTMQTSQHWWRHVRRSSGWAD